MWALLSLPRPGPAYEACTLVHHLKMLALHQYAARTLVAAVRMRPASTIPLPSLRVPSSQVEMTRSSLNALITQLEDDIPRSLSVCC